MERFEILTELEELEYYANENNTGSNEAELEYRELVADFIENLLKNRNLCFSIFLIFSSK